MHKEKILKLDKFSFELGRKTLLMGVMNMTPDSFSNDGLLALNRKSIDYKQLANRMIKDGADIIDIGAESSKPNAKSISAKDEIKRIKPALAIIAKLNVPVSVDTYKIETAQAALDAGASIINTIKGCKPDKKLLLMIRDYHATIVLMHSRGNPQNMVLRTKYPNLIDSIINELQVSIEKCLDIGIKKDRIIIDPGIGFAKNANQNLKIIKNLKNFTSLGFPILIGVSRKSFIGQVLNVDVTQRIWGTASAVAASIMNGVNIIRVHDVSEMHQVAMMTDAIKHSN